MILWKGCCRFNSSSCTVDCWTDWQIQQQQQQQQQQRLGSL
jgi:hypothetical protein